MKLIQAAFHEVNGVEIRGLGTVRVLTAGEGCELEACEFGVRVRHPQIPMGADALVPWHKVESTLVDPLPTPSQAPPAPELELDEIPARRGPGRPPKATS